MKTSPGFSSKAITAGGLPWGILLLFFSFYIVGVKKPKVLYFPANQPNNVFVMIRMPVGTDQKVTDSVTNIVEKRIMKVLGENNPDIESVISNVALNAGDQMGFDRSVTSEKGKVSINFVEYKYRKTKRPTNISMISEK
ncbi:MAG: efflux RND transporter permease subunit [Saprospiraceae bacterium]|nr:efflux RND transporter permease subunit [Saprospiraceae bacterium]